MVDLWANFAEYKNPTPKNKKKGSSSSGGGSSFVGDSLASLTSPWHPVKVNPEGDISYVNLEGGEMSEFIDHSVHQRMRFWREKMPQ